MSFKRYMLKYWMSLFIVFSLLVIIFVMSLFFITHSRMMNAQIQSELEQRTTYVSFSMNSVKRATESFATSQTLIDSLTDTQWEIKLVPVMNALRNASFGIQSVVVYRLDGSYTSTYNVSNVVSLESLASIPEIKDKMDALETSLTIRTTHISGIYDNFLYNPSFGMITYIVPILDEANHLGYISVDVRPQYLIQTYYDFNETSVLSSSKLSISSLDDEITFTSHSARSKTFTLPFLDDYTLTVDTPYVTMYQPVFQVFGILSALLFLFFVSLLILNRYQNAFITKDIHKLQKLIGRDPSVQV